MQNKVNSKVKRDPLLSLSLSNKWFLLTEIYNIANKHFLIE